MKTFLIILAVLVAAPLTARAQHVNVGVLDDSTNVATLTAGAEYGLGLGVGYARVRTIADRPIVLGGEATLGWAEVDFSDYRLRATALAPIVGGGRWKVLGGLTTTLRGTKNEIARMTNVGTDVAIQAGWYARRGFFGAELGFDWQMATHVEHAEIYRMVGYADARDGWYGNPGGVFRAGLQGGLSVGPYDVIVRAGRLTDVGGHGTKFPFYGTVTFDRRW